MNNWIEEDSDSDDLYDQESGSETENAESQTSEDDDEIDLEDLTMDLALSFTGERTTEVVVKRKNNLTHSYTVQPITSADGQLLDKFFRILQEKENEFGTRVQRDLIVSPNVVVRASKSGKSSDEKHRTFLNEVLRLLVGRKFLLFLDCWTT
ncbi:unnamed protein product [Rotaria sordida]|uniref:Uncharacterized protein n=1 Tax=Rotaria sordida TaxID=392033 RepID=A0A818Y3A9_9BILA|nr:unnamed protein product [Rotaria sordida]